MRSLKIGVFFCFAALLAGCFVHDSAEVSAEKTISLTDEAAVLTGKKQAETTISLVLTEEAEEGKRVFEEGKSYIESHFDLGEAHDYELLNRPAETDNPTLAEQLYQALYDFSVFFQYAEAGHLFYLRDPDDSIEVETVGFDWLHKSQTDRNYAYTDYAVYYRLKYGEITTIDDYYSRFFQVATERFNRSDAHLFQKQFALSNGKLYLTAEPQSIPYREAASGSRLNGIRKIISADRPEILELSFTASYEMYDRPYTKDYIIEMEYEEEYGWRVDGCSDSYAVGHLYQEILGGGENYENPKNDLLEEIELCLWQSGLM